MTVKEYQMKKQKGIYVLHGSIGCRPATESEIVFWDEIAALRDQVRRRDEALGKCAKALNVIYPRAEYNQQLRGYALAAIREARE